MLLTAREMRMADDAAVRSRMQQTVSRSARSGSAGLSNASLARPDL